MGDQINMTVFFWYLVKSDLFSVLYCTIHAYKSLLQGTRNKRASLTGHTVFVETTLDWNPAGDYSPHRAVLRARGS